MEVKKEQPEEESISKLSLNAMNSAPLSGTMRFIGSIHGHPIAILLDGGSDDNFIQPRVAKFLNLQVQPAHPIKVLVGDGNALQVEGSIEDLQVTIQGHQLQIPVYLLPIAGAELILGAAWLATLGPHMVDYQSKSIQFYCNQAFITLHGETHSGPQQTSIHQLHRLCTTNAISECYTFFD